MSGLYLLLNTCGDEAVVALGDDEARVLAEERIGGRMASEHLLGLVRRLMGVRRVSELAGLGVVAGPGSFTGVRVGLSAAKGLCEAGGIGMVAMSRLGLLAEDGRMPVLDAGRGEYFCLAGGEEGLVGGGELPPGPLVTCEAQVRERLGERVQLSAEPGGAEMLRAMLARVRAGVWTDVGEADASYLRRTDAELAVERAGA